MTLWHLLNAISFTAPLSCALAEGKKAGFTGIIIGFIVGLVVGLGSSWEFNQVGFFICQRIDKVDSEAKQEMLSFLLYLGMLIWILAASAVAFYAMRIILFHTV